MKPSVFAGALVATCGGDTVCLMDCESGMVMKKYKVAGEVGSFSASATFPHRFFRKSN